MSAPQFQRSHNQALSHVSVDSEDSQLHGSCEVSIILPCYNCAPFVERSFDTLCEHLDTLSSSWEIIMVDDGSADGTWDLVQRFAQDSGCKGIQFEENRGKGKAVIAGMAEARGKYRIFTDVDLPYRLENMSDCLELLGSERYQAVFGNRQHPESSIVEISRGRRVAGRIVRFVSAFLVGRRDIDTQCGLKGFSGELADLLFPMLTIDGFLFDVELCFLLAEAGVEIRFIPVHLVNQGHSTVSFLRTGSSTVVDASRIKVRRLRHSYDVSPLMNVGKIS